MRWPQVNAVVAVLHIHWQVRALRAYVFCSICSVAHVKSSFQYRICLWQYGEAVVCRVTEAHMHETSHFLPLCLQRMAVIAIAIARPPDWCVCGL